MPDLLLELRSEEIPAGAQRPASVALEREVVAALDEAGLSAGHAAAWSTPRRIAIRVSDLPAARSAARTERRGPRVGAPDPAVDGFCRAHETDRDHLEIRETQKGPFYFAVRQEPPVATADLLLDLIPAAVRRLPWPRSMRWGGGDFRWIRPLRGLLCVFDDQAVAFGLGLLTAGARTAGHRFLAPESFTIGAVADYPEQLRARQVLLDPDLRRRRILDQGKARAVQAGFALAADDDLVDELAGLTEWPVVLIGRFEESFLALPPEVLTTTMRRHQRYLTLSRGDGTPAPAFLMVADVEPEDGGAAIVAGNERVLRARLQDAEFFWRADRRIPLADRIRMLDDIVFHARLGSMADKARRLDALAGRLARVLEWDPERAGVAVQAARLAKTDLTTDLVGEFPELQGVVGGHLARAQGLGPEVATAIAEQYRPLGPRDRCPGTPTGALVALVDKLDTLAGFFWKGERPTGSGDPLALRRTALGLIRIALEYDIRIPVDDLLQHALEVHAEGNVPEPARSEGIRVRQDLRDFLIERLRIHLRSAGARHDHVAATLDAGAGARDLPGLAGQVDLLSRFLDTPEGAALQASYRRAAKIVKIESRRSRVAADDLDPARLREPEERALHGALERCGQTARRHLGHGRFLAALETLANLREPVDRFFEKVRVNADDPELRANRLRLLASLEAAVVQVADLSKLEGGESGGHE